MKYSMKPLSVATLGFAAVLCACSQSKSTAATASTVNAAPLAAEPQAAASTASTPVARQASAKTHSVSVAAAAVGPASQTNGHAKRADADSHPGIVMRAPHDAPEIVRIVLPSSHISPHQVVRAQVYTSSNTASVEARLYQYGMPLQRVGVGHFRLVYTVPDVPPYLKREWPVKVIARNVDGNITSKQVKISVY